ncbi:MAG: anti-sigma regulatory factor [Timaviella obliquedivisa GSE-PSE-MK23-08B]|jgi:serine/threonine-protein kinase RsbW|nr:anti-sigma regulatory factor [Timaviella obliquedivisa GSE-PSE-MK23-08B]
MKLRNVISADFCPLDPPKRVKILVRTDLSLLAQVLDWFDQFKHPTLPHTVWLQCQLALAEGFTNAVRHAHQGKPLEVPIEIEVSTRSQAIEIRIWDQGSGFDLERSLNAVPAFMDLLAEGGRGLKIIEKTSDVFSYTRTADHRNCLLIIRNYPPQA